MSKNPHYFWAVPLPDKMKKIIHAEMLHVKHIFQFNRWVHMDDYHITLVFLGAVEEQKLQTVIDLVGEAITEGQSFSLQITGLNIFGNEQTPRIFWGAVNEEHALFQLQAIVQQQCLDAGFTLDTRPYHPHITFARKWSSAERFDQELLTKYNPFQAKPLSFHVEEIVLYKTNMEQIPKYEPVIRISIK
ncbi:RNA 2',3'-cyclic phosphodiesterase [Lysinibacillus sp. KU-BSD001]|uniref:RNA 2',3'-cyclic phosphodiesterase n=1 Tax=Lysinibacillus sp. KU-BSD001 TaxID=3141328 RepID=UPI0036E5F8A3